MPIRKKRKDTLMKTIERKYGKDFGVRSDKKLGNYLKEKGYNSLSQMLKSETKGKNGKTKRRKRS
jgi:hypothetical protein